MYLVVGLGNPGKKYTFTRHNIGFLALDIWAEGHEVRDWKEEHKALTAKINVGEHQVLLAKPQTFMNLSGQSVQALSAFYKIQNDHVIVVHDEIEIPFEKIRIQKNRGAGGHNGIKSIHELLGTPDYLRLRLGVGRPAHPEHDVGDYVLQKFSAEEEAKLPDFLNRAADAMELLITKGLGPASTEYNK